MASMPATSPFAEDQLADINRLLTGATPEQRIWLSGYVAGFNAANDKGETAPAAPPARKPALTILYATESGNSETLALAAKKEATRLGLAPRVLDMADTSPADIARAGDLLIIASTWGEGDAPQRAEAFVADLMGADAPRFENTRYAVLALGDRSYAKFCETGRQIDERLAALGARRLAPRQECDVDFEAPARAWIGTTLREIGTEAGASVIHVDFMRPSAGEDGYSKARPFAAEITGLVDLNSSRSTTHTFHAELSLEGSGLAYEPGDSLGFLPTNDPALVDDVLEAAGLASDDTLRSELATKLDVTALTEPQIAAYASLTGDAELNALAQDTHRARDFIANRQFIDLLAAAPRSLAAEELRGLLRPLAPRLYSVASSRKLVGEEAHLLVGQVAWESHGRARNGVASGEIALRRRVGQTLPVYVQANRHFRLPQDAETPIIMIGPGTGVAPFRAFMQEAEATTRPGPSWLFFGARNFTHDFLYQLEWLDWLKDGVLSRMDVAFSRDQPEKIYVQHRMWEQRREFYAWLQEGAHLYICGDAKGMAKDVHATLLRIIAEQSGRDVSHAESVARDLVKSGRYLRDVY
jgi:sulfite reductase (NADPH) flavoprotein alpha-component